MRNKQILLSGRAVVTNAANVPSDRYDFLHLSDAEPSLGIAEENEFVLTYDTNSPGQRLWSKKLITAYQHANNAYESQNTTGIYANASFLKANSAYESQNVTGTYANNAYLHANSAYQSQNTTGEYANSAFLQANSAYESQNVTGTYANNAYFHANSAYDSQNTTGNFANSAFLKANSAYESQNVTGTYANNAYLHANSSYDSQNTTGVYANSAFLQANSSYESQNVTGTYANNAYLHANSAFDKANSAYESQNVTGIYANTSFEYANSAGQYANASFDYANSAYDHANASFIFANTRYSANGGEISGDVLITGNLIIQGTQFITETDTLAIHDNMIYLNNAIEANVINAVGNGTHVIYTTEITHGYDVGMGISVSGITPNSFNISGTSNTLIGAVTSNTFTVISSVTDTYISGGTARGRTSLNPDIGFAGGYYSDSYAHAGLFRDATDDTWKFFHNYTPEPDVSPYIDTSHPSFSIANLTANLITDVISLRGYDPLDASNAAYQHANSAYDSQNTTGIYSNSAFIHANAANLQANSAYESQNVTGTYANNAYTNSNAAFLQANSAYESQNVTGTYANNSYVHANSAYESQNVTGSYANSAFLQANSSYESQNVTGTYANNAYIHANSSYDSQNTTGVYANAAYLHANSAYASQNTTGIYANASFLKVNAAYQHANSAYDSQNTTGLYANAAFEKANAAVFTLTANTDQIYTNVATGNIQIGLANVNNDIGTFGGQEAIPVINVDGYGRITSIANTTITVPPGTYIFPNTNQLTANANSGNILIGLANVNNDIGTFGGTESIPVFEVDGFGRIVSVSNTTITVPPGTYIFPNTSELTANANSGNVLIGLYPIANNVGTFGSEFAVPTITIDTFGRVTDIVNTTISIPQGTYIVNSNLITANSLTGNVVLGLALSGVTAGTYGGNGQTPVITVDEFGRVTFGANVESSVNTLSSIIRNTYTATAGQTAFNTTGSFAPGYADVYVNGIKLSQTDYVGNPAGSVNIVNPTLLDGDVVDIQTATTFIIDSSFGYEKETFVATLDQTTFNFNYNVGELNVYLNGLRLKETDDYTANTGTTIVFPIGLEENDIVEIERLGKSYVKVVNPYMGTRETFVASANGQNTFTPVGGYRIGFVDIFLNGIKLNIGNDVVANNGTDFTIVSPTIEENDVIEIVGSAAEFSIANALPVTGGTITGSLGVTGSISSLTTVNAATFNATSNVNSANVVTTTLRTTDAFVSGNVTVTSNVVANAVNVATVYFNDGTQMTTAASGTGGGSGITWKIASANTTANSGEGILVNTLSANVHITLPDSPELGNTVRIVDMTGNFGINNCIVERNGQVIMGLAERLVISTNNAGIGLVFSDATHGWRIIENP